MKRVSLLLTVLAITITGGFVSPSLAQDTQGTVPAEIRESLAETELRQFIRNRLGLVLSTRERTSITGNTYTWLESDSPGLARTEREATITSEEIQRWQAYQGFSEISEPEFFRIAGFPQAADKAATWKTNKSALVTSILFGALTIASGVALGTRCQPDGCPTGDIEALGWFVGGLTSGAITIGYIPRIRRSGNWAPYSRAQAAASTYNRSLYEKLRKDDGVAGADGNSNR